MSTLYKAPLVYTLLPIGPFVYVPTDTYVGGSIAEYGRYSPSEMRLLRALCRDDDTFLDIGAQMGYVGRAVARQCAKVLLFEPQPFLAHVCELNAALAPELNVFAHATALGATDDTIHVPWFDYNNNRNYGAVDSSQWRTEGVEVALRRLDTLNLNRADVLKVDVEGMEREVLEGGRDTIREFQPTLFVENDRIDRVRDNIEFIEDVLGYDCYWAVTPLVELEDNPSGSTTNIFDNNIVTFNMVCVPRAREAREGESMAKRHLTRAHAADDITHVTTWTVLR